MVVGAPKLASKTREKLLAPEPEVEVGAPKQANEAPEKLLDQEPEVVVGAPKLGSRILVVVPTTAQAGL